MSPTRRQFLGGLGTLGLAYVLYVGNTRVASTGMRFSRKGNKPGVDFRDWLMISADGIVTVYTGRTEIGQGLTTVLYNLVGQGLDLPEARIRVALGDTDLCPGDGPTTGSAATRNVGWAFWVACHQIRADLVLLAAEAMGESPDKLTYRAGEIVNRSDGVRRMGIGDLANGRVRQISVDPITDKDTPQYIDRKTLNVNADAIVTGSLKFAGDYYPEGCLYGGTLVPEYHDFLTSVQAVDLKDAKRVPGITGVYQDSGSITAIGQSFIAVQKALDAADVTWKVPDRPKELKTAAQIRSQAALQRIVQKVGDAKGALAASDVVVTETYHTQFASQVPMEPPTAVAFTEGDRWVMRVGTQNPFLDRYNIAQELGVPSESIHIKSSACGGAFGAKTGHTIPGEVVSMAKRAGKPVKYVYSRRADIQKRSRYKESVVVDISTGLSSDGRILARTIEFYGDEGHGDRELYVIPHARTRLFRQVPMPVRHATMRGTSYTQNIFAIESHTDMVARAAGLEPLAFRRANVTLPQFRPVIDTCAEMFGYPGYRPVKDQGVGFAICNHGGRQLGMIAAEVRVDRKNGRIEVLRLAGAFDVGLVINENTATAGIKGAMIWGLGFALLEEVDLDGHRCRTTGFNNYRIPRMKDIPPIEIRFLNTVSPGRPRGCGEMPTPPTIAAIANAVYDAIGVRFYELPMTPSRVRAALKT